MPATSLESPSLLTLAESNDYWPALEDTARAARAIGPLIHDARVAALCRAHGIREPWTADRDFGRFPRLSARNPLGQDTVHERSTAYKRRRKAGAPLRKRATG